MQKIILSFFLTSLACKSQVMPQADSQKPVQTPPAVAPTSTAENTVINSEEATFDESVSDQEVSENDPTEADPTGDSGEDPEGFESAAADLDIRPIASLAAGGSWFGAELRSKSQYGRNGQPIRFTWRAKPAQGNCIITLMSVFNGDKIFTQKQGVWSELAFEIYGGAAKRPNVNALQTQMITYETRGGDPAQRGRQHQVQHKVGQASGGLLKTPPIFNGSFHTFQIEWLPSQASTAYANFRIDGKLIRRLKGGDVRRLEPALVAYSSIWRSGSFGCTDKSAPPANSEVVLDSFVVDVKSGSKWRRFHTRNYSSAGETARYNDLSNWGFSGFDGSYCPGNAVWRNGGTLSLKGDGTCRPN